MALLVFLFLLLTGFFQLLLQVALTVALQFWLFAVNAKVPGNVVFIQLVQSHNAQLHRALKHEAQENNYGYTLLHQPQI